LKIVDPNPCLFTCHLDLIQDLPSSYSVKLGPLAKSDIPVPCVPHLMLILLTSHGYSAAILFCTAPGKVLFLFILEVYIYFYLCDDHRYDSWAFLDEVFVYKVNLLSSYSSVVMNGS